MRQILLSSMIKMRCFVPVLLFLAAFISVGAGEKVSGMQHTYRQCDLSVGQVSFCGGPYTGSAVIRNRDAYRQCDLSVGQVSFCGGPYTGKVVTASSAF